MIPSVPEPRDPRVATSLFEVNEGYGARRRGRSEGRVDPMSDPAGDASDPDPGAEPASEGGPGEPAAGELDPGLFGKLPRSRPGARSPRRQQAGARSAPRRRERTPGT